MEESIMWDAEALGYLDVWAGVQVVEGKEFQEVNEVEGLENPVTWNEETKTLLLGDPLIINKDNVNDYDFKINQPFSYSERRQQVWQKKLF